MKRYQTSWSVSESLSRLSWDQSVSAARGWSSLQTERYSAVWVYILLGYLHIHKSILTPPQEHSPPCSEGSKPLDVHWILCYFFWMKICRTTPQIGGDTLGIKESPKNGFINYEPQNLGSPPNLSQSFAVFLQQKPCSKHLWTRDTVSSI